MFPGAGADRADADYVLHGAPLDRSASFRPGARFGPEAVRRMARGFEDYDRATDEEFSALGVHDAGDLRAWTDAEAYLAHLAGECRDAVADGAVPLLLGGEHTVALAGVRAVEPATVVVLDAHLDLRESFDGDPYSHATVGHRALQHADDLVVLGARAGSEAEWGRVDADDVTAVEPAGVPDWSPEGLEPPVYLSVDVDVADPAFAPATGTPEPGGLDARTLLDVVRRVAPRASGFDVAEVTDRDDGQTAALGAKCLRSFVYSHAAG